MKKPATLPMPSILAAHALPLGWSGGGSVSTSKARSTACTAKVLRVRGEGIERQKTPTGVDAKVNAENSPDGQKNGQGVILPSRRNISIKKRRCKIHVDAQRMSR